MTILLLLSVISICISAGTAVVTYFSVRKVNLWLLYSMLASIAIAFLKDSPTKGVQYPHLIITGIIFIVFMFYLCFVVKRGKGKDVSKGFK